MNEVNITTKLSLKRKLSKSITNGAIITYKAIIKIVSFFILYS